MRAREAGGRGGLAAPTWEAGVLEAVGSAIEFWGFKRNHGRVWAHLYLRGLPLAAAQIQEELGLSKGAVSMVVRELEQWDVVRRERDAASGVWRYQAHTDLMEMIRRVVTARESGLVRRLREDLTKGVARARAEGVGREELDRVERLRRLAETAEAALALFLTTARLDVAPAADVLSAGAGGRGRGRA